MKTARKKVVRKKAKRKVRRKKAVKKSPKKRVVRRKKAVKKRTRRKSVSKMTPNELFKEFNRAVRETDYTKIDHKRLSAVKEELRKRVAAKKVVKKVTKKRVVRRKKAVRKNPFVGVNPRRLSRQKPRISSKALATFRKIHGCDPDKIIKAGPGNETLIVLGEVTEVVYVIPFETNRDKGGTEWIHKFKKKPILCLTAGGKPAILFMKDHKITERGLIG